MALLKNFKTFLARLPTATAKSRKTTGTFQVILSAPLQGLLPVFAQAVLNGGPVLFGLMLSAIGLGSILGAFLLAYIPSYYPRHHLIPLAMGVFVPWGIDLPMAAGAVAMSLSTIIVAANAQLLRRLKLRPDPVTPEPAPVPA